MRKFAQLIMRLEESKTVSEKIDLLSKYLPSVESADAAWALWFLLGNRFPKVVRMENLQEWCLEISGIPEWLFRESYDLVKDKLETISLVIGNENILYSPNLTDTINKKIIPLNQLNSNERKLEIIEFWSQLDSDSIFIYNKLLTAGFRSGLTLNIISKSLAKITPISEAVILNRLGLEFCPTIENYHRLLSIEMSEDENCKPFPFHTFSLVTDFIFDTNPSLWMAEWNMPGLRVQLIKRSGKILIWSEKEEWLQGKFQEIESDISVIPFDLVIEGVIIAGNIEYPLPIAKLYKRISKQKLGKKSNSEIPAFFVVTDILSIQGEDCRMQTLLHRKEQLHSLFPNDLINIRKVPLFSGFSWNELKSLRNAADSRKYDGLLLKRIQSDYLNEEGNENWMLWKQEPLRVLAVLTYAQSGQSQSTSNYMEFSFGVWENGELRTIAKTSPSLPESELQELNTFIKANRLEKFGPVHTVKPELVFEISFEGIQLSSRHKSGIVLRAPKIVQWCRGLNIEDADTLEFMKAML